MSAEHGSRIRYDKEGCRCEVCRAAHLRRLKSYRVRSATTGTTTVDATQASEILQDLARQMSLSAIGRALGTSHHWVIKVIGGDIKRIGPQRHAQVIKLGGYRPADGSYVRALGTRRRLQALHAAGYTWLQISAETGYSISGIKSVVHHDVDSVKAHHAEDVRAAFERLLMTPMPVGGAATRARNQARKKGWPVPLAWENPDNPRERPRCSRYAA